MGVVVVHDYAEPNFKSLKKNRFATCEECMFSEETKLLDGNDGYLCHAALYDTKTLACFVEKNKEAVDRNGEE